MTNPADLDSSQLTTMLMADPVLLEAVFESRAPASGKLTDGRSV
jgi:hypothetical protein